MSTAEDILYQAHNEGIKDQVFEESKRIRAAEPQWKYKEFSDCIEEAYKRVKERNKKNNENL
tara:strand:+ start:284 stop:469 length:186 start_codon:yes stop_codon:yes gene_type:complete